MRNKVLVVGSGVVAHLVVYLLARKGLDIQHFSPDYNVKVPRVYAINQTNIQWLQAIDVWGDNCAKGYAPFHGISVWEDVPYQLEFLAQDMGGLPLGAMVSEKDLLDDLAQKIARMPDVEKKAEVVLDVDAEKAQVETQTGSYQGDWLIAADGGRSSVRAALHAVIDCHDYQQSAIVGLVQHDKPHDRRLRQRFLPEGPLALLAMQDPHQSALVWTSSTSKAEDLLALEQEDFAKHLTEASMGILGTCQTNSALAAFPLRAQHLQHYREKRVLYVGDAAHTVHPLAGQGLNYSFDDVRAMLACLDEIEAADLPIEDGFSWQRYSNKRYVMNKRRIQTLSAVNQLFSVEAKGGAFVRQLGMTCLNQCVGIKRRIMAEACGLHYAKG